MISIENHFDQDQKRIIKFDDTQSSEVLYLDEEELEHLKIIKERIGINYTIVEEKKNGVVINGANYVTSFALGHRYIVHITPKIDFKNVIWLTFLTDDSDLKFDFESIKIYYGTEQYFLDLLIGLFILECQKIVQKGLFKRYKKIQLTGMPKGRINFLKSFQKTIAYGKVQYQIEELNYNLIENQLITSLLKYFEIYYINDNLERIRKSVYRFLNGIKKINLLPNISGDYFEQVTIHTLNQHYLTALKIAKFIIGNQGPLQDREGNLPFSAFSIYMPDLIEHIFYYLLKSKFGNEAIYQYPEEFSEINNKYPAKIKLNPDYIIKNRNGEIVCVLDSKYKFLGDKSLMRDDNLQIMAYISYFNVPGILLYPSLTGNAFYQYHYKDHRIGIIKINMNWESYANLQNSIETTAVFLENCIKMILN